MLGTGKKGRRLPPAFGAWPPSPVLALKLYLELWREGARGAMDAAEMKHLPVLRVYEVAVRHWVDPWRSEDLNNFARKLA